MVPKRLRDALRDKRHKVFVVTTHVNPEGDAVGAALALASLLRRLGKKVHAVTDDRIPAEYAFLPGFKGLRTRAWPKEYDACVLVDCSDTTRIGGLRRKLRRDRLLVNIDHHVSNTRFARVNWVDPSASSASEMVYELFKVLRVPIRRREAVALYTGLMTDTGSFRFASTTSRTHAAAADLLTRGVDVNAVYRKLYEDWPFEAVAALGAILRTLRRDKSGTVAWLTLTASMLRRYPMFLSRTDDIIRFARSVAGAEVAVLFKEVRRGEVRVNLRSCRGRDVNRLARRFGGGGHPRASGCTLRGPLKDVVRRLVAAAAHRKR